MKPTCLLLAAIALASPATAFAQAAPQGAVLDHVAFYVADTQKSIDFYSSLFGLKEIPSPFPPGGPRWLVFANGLELHLQPGRTEPVNAHRRVHFAVTVPDLEPVLVWLRAHKVTWVDNSDRPGLVSHTRGDGVQQVFFQDPDGYWIEVNDVKKPS